MRAIILTIVFTMMLAATAAAATKSPFAGTWDGTMNGLPGLEITIDDAGGKLGGVVVFYF